MLQNFVLPLPMYLSEDKKNHHVYYKSKMNMIKTVHTFATAFGGYSPPSLVSMHCLTLSSLSLGVAYIIRIHNQLGCKDKYLLYFKDMETEHRSKV